jgi:hypothetical protein
MKPATHRDTIGSAREERPVRVLEIGEGYTAY